MQVESSEFPESSGSFTLYSIIKDSYIGENPSGKLNNKTVLKVKFTLEKIASRWAPLL